MVKKMKSLMIGKFCLIIFLALLMSVQIVSSMGVSQPSPHDLKLLRGDSAEFYFRISVVTEASDQVCSYSISGLDPLVITFDEGEEVTIDAGKTKDVYGTISVPEDAPIQGYQGMVNLKCKPYSPEGTGSVLHKSFSASWYVSVVEKEEERLVSEIPEKKTPIPTFGIPMSIIIIIIIILVIGGYYWSERKKK